MHGDIRVLLDVQELDREAIELNAQLAKYPQIWEETKKVLAQKKAAIETAEKNRERHQKERRRTEQKLRLLADDHRKYSAQLATVKTSREYEAINKQIEQVKGRIAQAEEQGLALLNRDEAVESAASIAKAEYEKYAAFAANEKERIREQFNTKKARLAEVEAAKAARMKDVSAEMIATYERINRRHPGSAIVPVRSAHEEPGTKKSKTAGKDAVRPGACGGCHFGLLPDVLVQVRRDDRIVFCPNCGRILSEDENFVPAESHTA
jgi:predicted  nucleic acid-binding Zn-ribbon protein